ncbi:F-box/kelch-repeat protein [Raphanus sativus]|nr:F-box/kelch-repeat protein [Raphanus sativus]
MEEPTTEKKRSSPLLPDWTQLPKELLEIITEKLDNCFNVIHARSVCTSWRSTFPFPSCLLRPNYSLPTFNELSLETNEEGGGSYTLGKIPYFLFRVRALAAESPSEYFFGGIGRDESEELPRPVHCSVKVKIQGSDPTLMNVNDCQIFPLGF